MISTLVAPRTGLLPGVWEEPAWAFGAASLSTVVACSAATGTLLDEFVQTADTSTVGSNDANQLWLAQSFDSGANGLALTGVCLRLIKIGSPTGAMYVHIYAHSGTYGTSSKPTGSALVSSAAFDVSTVAGAAANYFFGLSGWTPSASTKYCVVLDMSRLAVDATNNITAVYETGAEATHGGNMATSADGVTWVAGFDLAFKVYEQAASSSLTGDVKGRLPGVLLGPGEHRGRHLGRKV